MRFLEAKRLTDAGKVAPAEHKMQPGIREDQKPQRKTPESKEPVSKKVNISEAALELAMDNDIEIELIVGTGKDGAITVADVKKLIKTESND